ncbi:WD40 repeat domain-containing protein [Streptomyces sp. NPDC046977]|uniref:WD40 repeat domain-containing protein n=1 Tax=Streptomyces sp. NPDC046977 TaxID=3154703 RepID=UPI0033DC5599
MNVDQLVRDTLREQAAEQPALGPGFAERVLTVRRRRRTRTLASVAAATAAVVAVAVAVPLLDNGKHGVRLANFVAHPDQTPPRDLIAAGDVALAAYYTWDSAKQTDGREYAVRTYRLLDQKTGTYVKAPQWSRVAVASGMRTAAVLERSLPARRIGLLDLRTGEVERWIPVDHGVAEIAFSPDGSKLVATAYSKNPDLMREKATRDINGNGDRDWLPPTSVTTSRTGFYVLNVASGKKSWSEGPVVGTFGDGYFAFSTDGKLLHLDRDYFDFAGKQVFPPANDANVLWRDEPGVSPDGKFIGGSYMGPGFNKHASSGLYDARTGRPPTTGRFVRGYRLLAWADDKRLIAWDVAHDSTEPVRVRHRLVLVTMGRDEVVPLSGLSELSDGGNPSWTPVLARR